MHCRQRFGVWVRGLTRVALLMAACGLGPVPVSAHEDHHAHAAHGHDGHGHGDHGTGGFAAGEPGRGDASARTIEITMSDVGGAMAFAPSRIAVQRNEQVRFVLRNAGSVDHEFLIDTAANNAAHKTAMAENPAMQHDEPNGKRLAPGATAELLWRFSKAGTFEIACLIPGHYEAGMLGTVDVD